MVYTACTQIQKCSIMINIIQSLISGSKVAMNLLCNSSSVADYSSLQAMHGSTRQSLTESKKNWSAGVHLQVDGNI